MFSSYKISQTKKELREKYDISLTPYDESVLSTLNNEQYKNYVQYIINFKINKSNNTTTRTVFVPYEKLNVVNKIKYKLGYFG